MGRPELGECRTLSGDFAYRRSRGGGSQERLEGVRPADAGVQ